MAHLMKSLLTSLYSYGVGLLNRFFFTLINIVISLLLLLDRVY